MFDDQTDTAVPVSASEIFSLLQSIQQAEEIERPQHFSNLVKEMRKLNLLEFLNLDLILKKKQEPMLERYVTDALPLVKTEESVQIMVDWMKAKKVDKAKMEEWFQALALYKNPTRTMLASLTVSSTNLV